MVMKMTKGTVKCKHLDSIYVHMYIHRLILSC